LRNCRIAGPRNLAEEKIARTSGPQIAEENRRNVNRCDDSRVRQQDELVL